MVFDLIVLAGSLMESSDSGSLSMQNHVQCSLLDILTGNEVIPEMPGFHAQSPVRFVAGDTQGIATPPQNEAPFRLSGWFQAFRCEL